MKDMIIPARGPFDLRLTVLSHGFCQVPPFEWSEADGVLTMAVKPGRGKPITARVGRADGGVAVSTPGGAGLRKTAEIVSHCLRLDEDYAGFYSLCDKNERFRGASKAGVGRMLRSPSVFEDIVKSICGTNVAWRQAVRMIHAVCELGEEARGSRLRVFPGPEAILEAGPLWLRERARVGYRADYIIELCRRVVDGDLDLGPVDSGELDSDELKRMFLSVKGIGKATCNYLLMLHGEYANLSIDSATRALMRKITGEEMTDRQIELRYADFGEWKALALWYEWMTASGWLDGFEEK